MMIKQVQSFCQLLMGFAFFFWVWALKNTVGMFGNMFDWGLLSFGSVMLTSSYVLGMVNGGGRVPAKKSCGGIMFLLAPLFVALNYLLGAVLGFTEMGRPGFGIYCIAFTFLWLFICWYAHELLKKAAISSSMALGDVGM